MNLRKLARNQPCTVRLTSICDGGGETSVLAHIRRCGNAGMGQKPSDMTAVIACDRCHSVIDGRAGKLRANDSDILDALARTHEIWRQMGITVGRDQ